MIATNYVLNRDALYLGTYHILSREYLSYSKVEKLLVDTFVFTFIEAFIVF